MKFKQDMVLWYGVVKRAVVVGGLTLFTGAMANGGFDAKFAFIMAGAYMFVELAKNYTIDPSKIPKSKFLILP